MADAKIGREGASAPIDDKMSSIQLRLEGSLFFSSIF